MLSSGNALSFNSTKTTKDFNSYILAQYLECSESFGKVSETGQMFLSLAEHKVHRALILL